MPGEATGSRSDGCKTPTVALDLRTDAAPSPWTELADHLESVRRSILAEIRDYPPPIAACDQQFNYLLEQRDRVAGELNRLASMRHNDPPSGTDLEALRDFVTESQCIADELKAQLVQQLHQAATSRAAY
jgi:hypothetical protein